MPYIRLAKFRKGRVCINPAVPKKYRPKLKRHMRVFREARKKGLSRSKAIELAREAEHRGMSKKQIQKYEGELGAIARWGKHKSK
jgi:hypothetical protein